MSISPCVYCARVDNPEVCDNKACRVWRRWFAQRWNGMRRQPRVEMEQAEIRPVGVNIGGTYYAPPQRVRQYLENDPCAGCLCPRDLCAEPCRLKQLWLQATEHACVRSEQGGESMDSRKELVRGLRQLESQRQSVQNLEKALTTLSGEEQLVVQMMILRPEKNAVQALCQKLGVEQSSVYRRRDRALKKIQQAMGKG